MLKAAYSRIVSIVPGASIYIITVDSDRLKKFCPNAHAVDATMINYWRNTKVFPVSNKLLPKFLIKYLLRFEDYIKYTFPKLAQALMRLTSKLTKISVEPVEKWLDLVASMDCVIATGGGYINDSFIFHATGICNTLSFAQNLYKPTAMLGQGIGPISDKVLKEKIIRVLQSVQLISLREKLTGLAILKKWKINSDVIKVTGDDALEFAIGGADSSIEKNCAGINLRLSNYSGISTAQVNLLREFLKDFHEKMSLPYMPIPIDCSEKDSDEKSIMQLIDQRDISKDYKFPKMPEDLCKLIACCKFVITGSYHAAIFSVAQGIPVIGLVHSQYYQYKFDGIIDMFGSGVFVVDFRKSEAMKDLGNALDRALKFSDTDRDTLVQSAIKQKSSGENSYQQFFKSINLS